MADFPFLLWVADTSVTPSTKGKVVQPINHGTETQRLALPQIPIRKGLEGNLLEQKAFSLENVKAESIICMSLCSVI